MQKLKLVTVLCMSLFFSSMVHAASECCPSPPVCIPTMACTLEMTGGAADDKPNAIIEALSKGLKKLSQAYQAAQAQISSAKKAIVSARDSIQEVVVDVVKWPMKEAGQMLGIVKEESAEDDPESVTQDNRHGEDITVEDRIHYDLMKYADEARGDYASEHFTIEKRKFIRQQATITLMARMLVLKSHFKDMKKIVDEMDVSIEKMERGASSPEMAGKNEAEVLRQNQHLRLAWFKLLGFQKMVEAVKLEFAANQSIAGMKLVKKVPDIKTGEEAK